jgi:hypothetical protein
MLRWLACAPIALVGELVAWLLIPYAVRRAEAVIPADEPDLTTRTWLRLKSHPLMMARRLPKWSRWLLELSDDQLLPPGRYEPAMEPYRSKGWEAQSIAMLRRNAGHGLDVILGQRVIVADAIKKERGPRADDFIYGVWTGVVNDGPWQIMGLIRLPGPRDLQFNVGYVIRDLYDNPDIERPLFVVRYSLPSVRLPLKPKE